MNNRLLGLLVGHLQAVAVFLATLGSAHAQIDVEIVAGPNIIVDSNVLSPSTYAPDTFTVQVRYCNNTGAPIDDLYAHIGNIDGGGATAATPGVYPVRDSVNDAAFQAESPHLANDGLYSFSHAAVIGDATRYLGTLNAGECKIVYWMLCYPRVSNDGSDPVWGETRLESDDLWLEMDAWASQVNGATIDPANSVGEDSHVATMKNSISAMANKIGGPTGGVWTVTDASGNPVDTSTPAEPGELIKVCGTGFRLGVDNKGFDTDPDFAYDYGVWIQPVGDKALFDPFCYRLVRTEGQLRISRSGGNPTYTLDFVDQTYFRDLPNDTNGGVGDVCYFLVAMSGPCSAALSPYQLVASGAENEKFNADFGAAVPRVATGESLVDLTKTVDLDNAAAGAALTYDITFTNPPGADSLGLPEYGLPIVVNETIPTGATYVGGSAEGVVSGETAANSITAGSGGFLDVYYSVDGGTTYANNEPVDPTTVTNVQWWLDSQLLASGTVFVQFQVLVDDPFSGVPLVDNTVGLSFGDGPIFKEAVAGTLISGDNAISGMVWEDVDYSDTLNSETQSTGVAITLYYDVNNDKAVDPGDILIGTQDTGAGSLGSDADSTYAFSSLPDGNFIVVVNSSDPDIPAGYSLPDSYTSSYAIDLDSAGASGTGVDSIDNDWAFIPALTVTKTASPTSYNEGELVNFNIDLENHMAPVPPAACFHDGFAQRANSGSWTDPTNAQGAPNLTYAFHAATGNDDPLDFGGFDMGFPTPTDTIDAIDVVIRNFYISGPFDIVGGNAKPDYIDIEVWDGTAWVDFVRLEHPTLHDYIGSANQGDITISMSAAIVSAWTWATITSGTQDIFRMSFETQGNSDGVTAYVDAVELVASCPTTPATAGTASPSTIDPLPLTDTYDQTKLQYVSASITPTSVAAGTITWANVGPLHAGNRKTVTVSFLTLTPPDTDLDLEPDPTTTTNTASSTGAVFLSGGPTNNANDTQDIDIIPAGSIGDYLYWDIDGSGTQNVGDLPLQGVLVELLDSVGTLITSMTTDASGLYNFTALGDADYTVRIATSNFASGGALEGFSLTDDPDDGTPDESNVTINTNDGLSTNDSYSNQDFGYDIANNIVSGTLWYDYDGDGMQDGNEPPIVGQSVNLTIGMTVVVATTDSNGFYIFSNVADGNYTVSTTPPSATILTTAANPIGVDVDSAGALDGTVFPDNDFGFQPSGSLTLGDTLYMDWNGDGTQDGGEEGIENITVSLYADIDGDGAYDPIVDTIVATDVSDSTGTYGFAGLASGGDYLVLVDTSDPDFPANLTQTQDPDAVLDSTGVAANLTASDDTFDFGYQPLGSGSIGDTVFIDTDADGIHDSGESGIADITVTLYEDSDGDGKITAADAVVATAATDASGNYLFEDLAPGDYLVDVDGTDPQLPTETSVDMVTTLNYIPTSSDPHAVTLSVGENYLNADFGFAPGGAIGNFVWEDLDADGEFDDTEPTVVGMTINLYLDTDGNGVGDILIATTTTDANGLYLFDTYDDGGTNTGLPAGNYVVEIVKTPTQTVTYDLDGNNDTTTAVVLLPGQTFGAADFGVTDSSTLVIGDTVWIDSNGDGFVDAATETLLSGVKVELIAADGFTVVDTAYTDAMGNYAFGVPDDGSTYSIVVDVSTLPFGGLVNTTDKDSDNDNDSGQFTLAGSDVLDADFGYQFSGAFSISGTAFNDTDSSADWQNTTEPTYQDVTVYLWYSPDGGTTWINIDSQLTGSNGSYSFDGYPAGTYTVAASPGAAVLIGTHPTTPQNQQVVVVDRAISDIDFGFVGTASVGDTVFYDTDGNGSQGGAEDGIPGVQVTLTYPNGQTVTTTTDASGNYLFQGLGQGPYTITVDASTFPGGTSNTADPDGNSDSTALVNLNEGQVYNDGDFGYQTPGLGSIGDTIWADLNGDGVFDQDGIDNIVGTTDDEFGIKGVVVDLYDADDPAHDEPGIEPPIATTTTDSNGLYGFPALTTGNYIVFVADTDGALAGYDATYDEDGGTVSPDGTAPVNLPANDTLHDTADFGYSPNYASISGVVYDDDDVTNNDTIGIGEDTPIAGVLIALWSDPDGDGDPSDGVVIARTITDSGGSYGFANLLPGDYVVVETDPSGFSSDADTAGANDNWIPVDLQGVASTANDFLDDGGSLNRIGGSVYLDTGDDNILDGSGETPVEGVTVTLYRDINGDGDYSPSIDLLIDTTLTGGDGSYLFQNLPDADYLVVETDPVSVTGSDTDTDGTGSNDANTSAVTLAGSDNLTNDFLDSVDPSGYFYDSSNGTILTGGSISVSGPATANIVQNGSTGEYSWIIDGAFPGVYTMSITPPPGYVIDPNRPVAGSNFDPTGGPDPTELGSDETAGTLDDFTSGANPYYLTFDLAAGDPFVELNNIPFASKNTFDSWKSLYGLSLPGETAPTDNPDSDIWNNALEYALCLPPKSGVPSHPPFCALAQTDGTIDAAFYRIAGGATDITYRLQGASQLGNPTSWTTLLADVDNPGGVTVSITNQGDGSEFVRIEDLASIGTVTNQSGFIRLCVDLASPVNTSCTMVQGWHETVIETDQCEGWGNPFLMKDAFSGTIDSVASGAAVNKWEIFLDVTSGAGVDFSSLLDFAGNSYYIEIISGDLVGHRFDLVAGGMETLEIAADNNICAGPPYNTTNTTIGLPSLLAGDRFILRAHMRLEEMFSPQAAFNSGFSATTADRLLVYKGSGWNEHYYDSGLDSWSLTGASNSGTEVLPPCQGLYIHPRLAPVTILAIGVVRENPVRCPLASGYNFLTNPYPLDLTTSEMGLDASVVDGGGDPSQSDRILIWNGNTDAGQYAESYTAYFYLEGYSGLGFADRWLEAGDNDINNTQDDTKLFVQDRATFYFRKAATCVEDFQIPLSWQP